MRASFRLLGQGGLVEIIGGQHACDREKKKTALLPTQSEIRNGTNIFCAIFLLVEHPFFIFRQGGQTHVNPYPPSTFVNVVFMHSYTIIYRFHY